MDSPDIVVVSVSVLPINITGMVWNEDVVSHPWEVELLTMSLCWSRRASSGTTGEGGGGGGGEADGNGGAEDIYTGVDTMQCVVAWSTYDEIGRGDCD